MRRLVTAAAALALALVASAAPAAAQPPVTATGGWVPAPAAPFTFPAGARCDFPVTGMPIIDEVRKRVLTVNPDGSAGSELFVGDLVIRITNTSNGESYDADASGQAVIVYAPDGAQTWYVHGPVLVGFAEDGGNQPRGLYIIDGLYQLRVSASGDKTVTLVRGTIDDLCARVR